MTRSHYRWVALLGLAAPAVYVAATAAGSVLHPGYSQVRHHVSELTASGAPAWAALAPAYVTYNVMVAGLGVALYATSRDRGFGIGAGLLGINATGGVLSVTLLRQDPGGVPTTLAGTGHIVLAGLMVVADTHHLAALDAVAMDGQDVAQPLVAPSGISPEKDSVTPWRADAVDRAAAHTQVACPRRTTRGPGQAAPRLCGHVPRPRPRRSQRAAGRPLA